MVKTTRKGATPEDWDNLDLGLGLTEDLLPVVSNPDADISSGSNMKFLGKTPSIYNHNRQVMGFLNWTQHKSTGVEVDLWANEPDYGICLQTRNIRALDIDVDDETKAQKLQDFVKKELNLSIPVRFRENSGKCLLAFRLEGEYFKRTVKVDGGIIEFLATGQQFIAHGTHPSGVRYEWAGFDDDFPTLTEVEFERLWRALCENFGLEEATEAHGRKRGPDLNIDDPVVEHLEVLGTGKDGQLYIDCPFKHEHTQDSGIDQTVYFPAGSGGYAQGHFNCFHAHCAHRTDEDFLDALGIRAEAFDVIEAPEKEIPSLERNQHGQPKPTISNVLTLLKEPEVCGWHIAKDLFFETIMIKPYGKLAQWRELEDADNTMIRSYLETRYGFSREIGKDKLRDAIILIARKNSFDSIIEWGEGLKWDGVERVKYFYSRYCSTEQNEYTEASSLYLWTALGGRAVSPGVKADIVPIWTGAQGVGKTTGVAALAPKEELFTELCLAEKDDDRARRIKGKLVAEFGELRGLYAAELETLKSFITRQVDVWIPKYMENTVKYPRRVFCIGTTNHIDFLNDNTGIRRWNPIEVGFIDTEAIKRDREQLWAEAIYLFKKNGVMWRDVERLSNEIGQKHVVHDPWIENIQSYLSTETMEGKTPLEKGYVTTSELLQSALGMSKATSNSGQGKRLSELMRHMGFDKKSARVDGRVVQVWRGGAEWQKETR